MRTPGTAPSVSERRTDHRPGNIDILPTAEAGGEEDVKRGGWLDAEGYLDFGLPDVLDALERHTSKYGA